MHVYIALQLGNDDDGQCVGGSMRKGEGVRGKKRSRLNAESK